MKKQLLSCMALVTLFSGSLFAQWQPKELDVFYTVQAPVVDGVADGLWSQVEAQAIDVAFANETVSLGDGATFRMLWDDDNIYVLVEVDDDNHYDHVEASTASWLADKPELYFDVTFPLVDGGGPDMTSGHHQAAPDFDTTMSSADYEFNYAFVVNDNDSSYTFEYALPYTWLLDANENPLDPSVVTTIGFDITILDLDADGKGGNDFANGGRGRINWSNNAVDTVDGGEAGESWGTLDQAGLITFIPTTTDSDIPYASAGKDVAVNEGDTVYLDGSRSFDWEDSELSVYQWKSDDGVVIGDANKAKAYVVAPGVRKDSVCYVSLTVMDSDLNQATDSLMLTVLKVNIVPVANAGEDAEYAAGQSVIIDGSLSTDGDGDALTYSWLSLDAITFSDNKKEKQQFVAPEVEDSEVFQFVLYVSDDEDISEPDTLTITISNASSISGLMQNTYKLKISPNPATNLVSLEFDEMKAATLQVVSIDGRIIENTTIANAEWMSSYQLDISAYQSGMYTVVLSDGEKVFCNKLLVK